MTNKWLIILGMMLVTVLLRYSVLALLMENIYAAVSEMKVI